MGRIEAVAEVSLNGKCLGVLCKLPFILDITDTARPGRTSLERVLKAAAIFGCTLRGPQRTEDQSGIEVQIGLNTTGSYHALLTEE